MSWFKDENRALIIKRLLILFAVILLIFATINVVWYFGYKQRYNAFAENLEESYLFGDESEEEMLRYSKEVGDYAISLKMPSYLGSGGFITIYNSEGYTITRDEDGNIIEASEMDISLYIWPKYFSGYKIGLEFYDEANDIWEQVEFTTDWEITNIDDDAYVDYIYQLISEHSDEINTLLDIASEYLGIEITRV